jgi:hypothetical protein
MSVYVNQKYISLTHHDSKHGLLFGSVVRKIDFIFIVRRNDKPLETQTYKVELLGFETHHGVQPGNFGIFAS